VVLISLTAVDQFRSQGAPQEQLQSDEHDQWQRWAIRSLAYALRRQWEAEAELRGLRRPRPLRIQWSVTSQEVTDSLATVFDDRPPSVRNRPRLNGDERSIAEFFQRIPRKRLVIVGKPGSGKTILEILLTLDLLREDAETQPVPVILSISSWDSS